MLDKNKFVELMAGLSQLYDKELSQFALNLYYEILENYDYLQIESAIKQVISTNKYNCIPKPAEILEFLEGTRDDKALLAWLQVMEAVQKGGYYASIEFSDPIISHAVNELGGWQWLCCSQKDDLPFIEKRFMDLYRLFIKKGVSGNPRLIGFIECRNNAEGHLDAIPEPIRIGYTEDQKLLKEL
jgi:hypothetical protein